MLNTYVALTSSRSLHVAGIPDARTASPTARFRNVGSSNCTVSAVTRPPALNTSQLQRVGPHGSAVAGGMASVSVDSVAAVTVADTPSIVTKSAAASGSKPDPNRVATVTAGAGLG